MRGREHRTSACCVREGGRQREKGQITITVLLFQANNSLFLHHRKEKEPSLQFAVRVFEEAFTNDISRLAANKVRARLLFSGVAEKEGCESTAHTRNTHMLIAENVGQACPSLSPAPVRPPT